jgi:hypothetical protein
MLTFYASAESAASMLDVAEPQAASAKDPVIKTDHEAERRTSVARKKTAEIISLLSPEPEVRPAQETNDLPNRNPRSISPRPKSGIKREAIDAVKGAVLKRAKGLGAEASEDPLVAAINAAVERYREEDAAEKYNFRSKIQSLEEQLLKSQEENVRLQAQRTLPGTSPVTVIVESEGVPPANEQPTIEDPCADHHLLRQTVADLSIKNSELEEALREKIKELSQKDEELRNRSDMLRAKDVDLESRDEMIRAKDEEVQSSDQRLADMAEDLRAQKVLWRDAGSELNASKAETNLVRESAKSLEKKHIEQVEVMKGVKKVLENKEKLLQEQRKITENYRKQVDSLQNTFAVRDITIKGLKGNLRLSSDTLAKTKSDLMEIKTQKCRWEERAKDMYSAYQEVFDKNKKLTERVRTTLEACTSGSVSKKNLKMLEKLTSRPLKELDAYRED